MPNSSSGIWYLVKSVILPVDVQALASVYREIREDAESTSWLELFYRLEGIAVLILIAGIITFGVISVNENGIGFSEVQTIGIQYAIGLVLLAVIILMKGVVWIVQRVNTGESIWGSDDEISGTSFVFRAIISSAFVFSPLFVILELNVPIQTVILFIIISCVILGSVVAGLCGIFTLVLLSSKRYSERI